MREYVDGTIGAVWDKTTDLVWLYKRDGIAWKELHRTEGFVAEPYQRLRAVISLEQNPDIAAQAFYYTPEEFEAITGMRL